MKTQLKSTLMPLSLAIFFCGWLAINGFINVNQGGDKKWVAPDAEKNVKNPVKADDVNIPAGKTLYTKHCKSCHGTGGKGDGTKAAELETPCGDFTTDDTQKQTDGELHYKIKKGKDDMPSFEKKILADEDLWTLVNYMRTLKKK